MFAQHSTMRLTASFVDTKTLPSKPDMSKLLTEAYLPQ